MPETEAEQIEIPQPAPEAEPEPTPDAEPAEAEPTEDDLPEWAKEKIRKANREAKNLRSRMDAAAREAERAKLDELERERAEHQDTKNVLAQRDIELLQARYSIPDEYLEFITGETFEDKESRAIKVGQMVKKDNQERPPTERPVESLKPGASPSTPPVEDHSYPANWGFQPQRPT